MSVDYPGAIDMVITDPAWVFTDALAGIPASDLTIVNHKTASGGFQTATQIAQFFHNDTVGHKSAHFVVGRDGSVIQVVKLKDGAGANCCLEPGHNMYWTPLLMKYGNMNRCTISIEHEDWTTDNSQPMTRAQVDASNKLNLWLVKRYGLSTNNIHSHASMRPGDRARCPGPTFDFTQLFAFITAGGTVNPPTNTDTRTDFIAEWQASIPGISYTSGIANFAWSEYQARRPRGAALSHEFPLSNGRIGQTVNNGIIIWENNTATYHPYP